MSENGIIDSSRQSPEIAAAYSQALLRTLASANVKFVRFLAVDICNSVRCKVIPVDFLRKNPTAFDNGVSFARVCLGGLPSFADVILEETGLDAVGTLQLLPDASTLRILPYAPSSALVLGTLVDRDSEQTSDLCCRSLLRRVVEAAREEHRVDFTVGAELEFCLCDGSTDYPVDCSNFADTVLLNRQEEFISTVYEHLQQQDVEVELLHAESAHGQMELVLRYRTDPVQAADDVILARETVRAVANGKGLKALFLPKVAPAAAGNGFHVHLSMQDVGTGRNVFTDLNSGNGISARGQSFMEGMLRHMPAITAFTLPTVNSYRRVGPGCWTGSTPSWAYDDKESGLRVVSSSSSSSTGGAPIIMERVEFKLCDSTANLYLALAALLSAGLEGMKQQWGLRPANDTTGRVIPTSLAESLNNLESSEFFQRAIPKRLLKGYLALRRAEAERASSMSLEDEVKEALQKA